MRQSLVVLAAIFAASSSYAKLFRVEPPAPTSGTAIRVIIAASDANGCHPYLDHIDRAGSTITLRYLNNICLLTPDVWSDSESIGVLPPGVYTIAVALGGQTLDSYDLWVRDDNPPLKILPSAKTAGAIEPVQITSRSTFSNPTVTFGDTAVPAQFVRVVDPHTIIVTTMPHDPGLVDVTVQDASGTITAPQAFRFVASTAPPDPAIYERVLLPIVFNGFGAFGTWWRTDVNIFNGNPVPFVFDDAARTFYFSDCVIDSRCPGTIAPAETAFIFDWLTKDPSGVILFPERELAGGLTFGYRMWEMSQFSLGLSSGTELPVVREREFRTGKLELPAVPVDRHARMTLRIYGPDSQPMAVHLRLFGGATPIADTVVVLQAPPCATDPCDSPMPSFAAIGDLLQSFPQIASSDQMRIEIEPVMPYRVWAFVAIANNTTQHVTLVTPQ